MRVRSLLVPLVLVLFGLAAVLLGGADDSPGLQGLGVLLVGGAVILVARARGAPRP